MSAVDSVLIAGGGVVGLTAALSLARKGVPVTVLEAESELVKEFRASTFHPPTLEMLDELGVAEQLIADGIVSDRFQYRGRKEGLIAEFDLGVLKNDTRYPFRVQLEQYALAVMLHQHLQQMPNVDIKFHHKVTDVALADDHVLVTAETPQGQERFRASYLIGADGANSVVRHALDINFEGMTYPTLFLVLFTTFEFFDYLPDICDVNYIWDPVEWYMLLRSPGIWRVVFPTRPGETEEEAALDTTVQERLQGVIATGKPYPVLHHTLYRVHQRVAASYRKGRALLAGDAAHVNSPLGGMGLNGGIHDAVNLSEKLARVWHGEASDELLDTYASQRRHTAVEFVQAQTRQNVADAGETDPTARNRRHEELRRTAADPELARSMLLRTSMIESLRSEAGTS